MFSKTLLSAASACALLASCVGGHMVITSPVPYGAGSLTNSPLEPDGSDFPCKQRPGVYDVTTMNSIPVGVPQKLSFKGGATHGGGSCQVSVTLDKEPTKDSDWKVIHSIVGGCPSDAAGNADASPTYLGASTFEYSMPKGMPNGEYTLAWTWFNKIGNREMYMNCAPITVTGGSDDKKVFDTLPSMFVANIPADQCATVEGEDFVFPNPGLYVETAAKTALGSATSGNCGAAVAPTAPYGGTSAPAPATTQAPSYGGGGGAGSGGSPGSSSSMAADADAGPTSPALTLPAVVKGLDDVVTATTLATVTASGDSYPTPEPTESAESSAPLPTSYSPPASQENGAGASADLLSSNGTASAGGCPAGATPCSTPGSVVCIGRGRWGMCNIDNCAVPRELTAGTSCAAGVVSKRNVHEHVRRHVHHGRSF